MGTVVVGFADLYLSIAAPPSTLQEALHVAAEHLTFGPDNICRTATLTPLSPTALDYLREGDTLMVPLPGPALEGERRGTRWNAEREEPSATPGRPG
ncbi:DUF4253 domain-containing protein [Nonomuraea sp. JJY05]|uniref:DUF4253 domain-containing protein n=1 Tax=Nonomuraea sp. JJY05 TaxID=3350255 RepID=UPI00373E6BFC